MDPEVYLQPDFDPAKHKMADLRNILLQNNVAYPSSARKQHLVDLFNEHIRPLAEQKLKELNSVVAAGDGIEIIEKKDNARSGRSKTPAAKPESDSDSEGVEVISGPEKISATKTTRTAATRKSPRRVAQSDTAKRPTRIASGDLKDIPKLEAESPEPRVKRERSPRRVASGSNSRRREASNSEKSPTKVKEDTEKIEKTRVSPFKVDPKLESSFSHDNVFQSPIPSSPDFKKVIPKKRVKSTESPEKEVSKKNPRVLKKTAFSSSPAPQRSPEKSPLKKSLTISKFEDENDSFSEKFKGSEALQFDTSNEKSIEVTNDTSANNSYIASANVGDNLESDDVFHVSSDDDKQNNTTVVRDTDYATPQSGNASRISIASSIQGTPSRTPKIPYSKAQSSLRENLTSWFKKTPKAEENDTTEGVTEGAAESAAVKEDPEQLEDEHEDEDEASIDVLQSLQNEIESVYESVVNETNEAVKQVNDLFKDEDVDVEGADETTVEVKSKLSLSIPWRCIFNFLQKLVVFIMLCVLVVGGLWYREQRILIGYCGSEIDVPTFPYTENVHLQQLDDFLQDYKPQCLKCPEHAICLPKLTIKCKEDYIVNQPWYKFYNVFPFPDYCVKDHEKENAISEVVAKSLDLLRTRNAAVKCGDGDDLEVGISDDELYEFFYNSKKPSISDEEFDNIWSKVLEDLEKEPEIIVRIIESSSPQSTEENISSDEAEEETVIPQGPSKVLFRSNSSLKLSISCKFKKEVYERFEENKYYVTGVLASLVIFTTLYLWYSQYQQRQSKIREVSAVIISKLQKQQRDAINDTTGLTNRYLSTIQLRDELLAQVRSKEKFNIWASILSQVEKNSNVRSSSKEIHGDIVRVLEWIGE